MILEMSWWVKIRAYIYGWVTKAARKGARGPRESPRTRRSERRPANIASRELHVVTFKIYSRIVFG